MEIDKTYNTTKYGRWYLNIVSKAQSENRILREKSDEEYQYYESHHILPRCLYPEFVNLKDHPWNGVLLTTREHFVCHLLLVGHYKKLGKTRERIKLSKALRFMDNDGKHTSKIYASLRLDLSHSETTKQRISESLTGKSLSEEHKQRLSNTFSNTVWANGKRISKEEAENVEIKFGRNCDWIRDTVSVIEISTGKRMRIPREEYLDKKNKYKSVSGYGAENKGGQAVKGTTMVYMPDGTKKRVTVEEKQKYGYKSIYGHGEKNNSAIVVELYDQNGKLIDTKQKAEKIEDFCNRHGLSISTFIRSYLKDKPINSRKHKHIKGWKAVKK